ncbi:aminoglycoside N(3)-acetyltransferase [Paenibacillus soyae]|uniref:Aminoglycoside N(3)-acetyltransferase n=1 Tax=Paenibacillus soyae TaxID=2969249 RepID=A0A9X2S9I4_9BACL|nr:AAC(3) family N-acetyltransferase [Paenibacillus soyae]MCR2803588.1 AAC(3) family N-acetyltransferase [Paenibacillus soyae]
MTLNTSALPLTVSTIAQGLRETGVKPGMTLLVHASLKAANRWIAGGPSALILALEQTLGGDGTLVMPAHTPNLSEPSEWRYPPVPEEWWEIIRAEMPPFEPDLTPSGHMGVTAECFRKRNGTLRSRHPQLSFAAKGKHAAVITENHSIDYGLGEQSPLARLYELDGYVLLFGVGYDRCTSLHLSEYRAEYASKAYVKQGAPLLADGQRQWVTYDEINLDSDDFARLGEAFEKEVSSVQIGKIGDADIRLVRVRPLVDFGVRWIAKHR